MFKGNIHRYKEALVGLTVQLKVSKLLSRSYAFRVTSESLFLSKYCYAAHVLIGDVCVLFVWLSLLCWA